MIRRRTPSPTPWAEGVALAISAAGLGGLAGAFVGGLVGLLCYGMKGEGEMFLTFACGLLGTMVGAVGLPFLLLLPGRSSSKAPRPPRPPRSEPPTKV